MKYFSKPAFEDGIRFDSQAERDYYLMLKGRPEVRNLRIHPRYILQPAFEKAGPDGKTKKWHEIGYEADFEYEEGGRIHVVDVKGYPDPAFPIHRKMFEYVFPYLSLEVVRYSKATGWVSYDGYRTAMKKARKAAAEKKAALAERESLEKKAARAMKSPRRKTECQKT